MWCSEEQDSQNRMKDGAIDTISVFVHDCNHLGYLVSFDDRGPGCDADLLDEKSPKTVSDENEWHRILWFLSNRSAETMNT